MEVVVVLVIKVGEAVAVRVVRVAWSQHVIIIANMGIGWYRLSVRMVGEMPQTIYAWCSPRES